MANNVKQAAIEHLQNTMNDATASSAARARAAEAILRHDALSASPEKALYDATDEELLAIARGGQREPDPWE